MSKLKKRRRHAKALTKQNKFAMVSITAVVCMVFGVLLYKGHYLEQRIAESELKKQELNARIQEENDRTEEIYELEEYMQTKEYVKSVAQNKLGLVKENEIIFKPKK